MSRIDYSIDQSMRLEMSEKAAFLLSSRWCDRYKRCDSYGKDPIQYNINTVR
jgi:hypothetical protein